jgi:acyl-CoA reductase-like NAD-dependent aldehyde dehydrogenase
VVWKPSELTPLIALEVEKIAKRTFALPDLLQVVTGAGATGAALAKAASTRSRSRARRRPASA